MSGRVKNKQKKSGKKKEQRILEFISITSASESVALTYLESNNWQLNEAVQLFFAAGPAAAAPTSSTFSAAASAFPPPPQTVRAPIPSKRQRLTDVDPSYAGGFGARNARRGPRTHEPFRQFSREQPNLWESTESGGKEKKRDLASLFAPPHKIMFRGSFDQLMQRAQQSHRWVLVNINCTSEFDSHRLNRDTWSDETLQEIVGASFLFWQIEQSSALAHKYKTFYKVHEFPHIGLVDPRTGELMFQCRGFIQAEDLISRLSDVMDKHSLEPTESPAIAAPAPAAAPAAEGAAAAGESDEDLARALAMSMAEIPSAAAAPAPATMVSALSPSSPESAATSSTVDDSADDQSAMMTTQTPAAAMPSAVSPEPDAADPMATAIHFRLPTGARLTRRFKRTDKVEQMFCFVRSALDGASGRAFDLRMAFPPKSLQPMIQATLEGASVLNSVVMVRWT